MKNKIKIQPPLYRRGLQFTAIMCCLLLVTPIKAQLPTAQQLASKMKVGWNLGNTLECPTGETGWGGAYTTQKLIDSVKMAGFNTVRLPVAWFTHSDTVKNVIQDAWLSRVREVINYCIKDSMYVVVNIHWDSGWLENHITVADSARVNARQKAYWTQIASYFKYYGDHLLFASANEPDASNATGMAVLLSYHQTFVNAVRSTGGNNTTRTLIVQGPQTNIDLSYNLMNKLPVDLTPDRLMVEVHYYTPPNFCILSSDATWGKMFYYWGKDYHSTTDVTRNATWGEESDVEKYLNKMKTKYVDNGIPVIIGEYAAIKRTLNYPSDQALHEASYYYFNKYVTKSMISKGIIPYYWDINMGMFNRSTGKLLDPMLRNAIMQGAKDATTDTQVLKYDAIDIYPNPFTSTITLKFDNPDEIVRISIFDMIGRQVETFEKAAIRKTFSIGSSLQSGLYLVKVDCANRSGSYKIIKN
jgi:aryl-phospho-beta-D-glucosidase BglC (GH1 family)